MSSSDPAPKAAARLTLHETDISFSAFSRKLRPVPFVVAPSTFDHQELVMVQCAGALPFHFDQSPTNDVSSDAAGWFGASRRGSMPYRQDDTAYDSDDMAHAAPPRRRRCFMGSDVRSGHPGFIPRAGGGDRLDPSYLDPRPEARLASGWTPSIPYATREDLGLPQTKSEQFAGVGLGRDAGGGYGLDPHSAAPTRRASDAERYIPSVDEIIAGNRMFTEGRRAPPFGFAGPGSLLSLESNNTAVAPRRIAQPE